MGGEGPMGLLGTPLPPQSAFPLALPWPGLGLGRGSWLGLGRGSWQGLFLPSDSSAARKGKEMAKAAVWAWAGRSCQEKQPLCRAGSKGPPLSCPRSLGTALQGSDSGQCLLLPRGKPGASRSGEAVGQGVGFSLCSRPFASWGLRPWGSLPLLHQGTDWLRHVKGTNPP